MLILDIILIAALLTVAVADSKGEKILPNDPFNSSFPFHSGISNSENRCLLSGSYVECTSDNTKGTLISKNGLVGCLQKCVTNPNVYPLWNCYSCNETTSPTNNRRKVPKKQHQNEGQLQRNHLRSLGSDDRRPKPKPVRMPSKPTCKPKSEPTRKPKPKPVVKTTRNPTSKPRSTPTSKPTSSPTSTPTSMPTSKPTSTPTSKPTSKPTFTPTSMPTNIPTSQPTNTPTSEPTSKPTSGPTANPVNAGPVTFADVWINEFHYDNAGADAEEFIEVAYKTSVDITGYKIVLYNGNTASAATTYNTLSLDSFTKTVTGSIGFAVNPTSVQIQNGLADGMALVDATDRVIQFLSYEGVMTASNGPAIGLTSTDIGKIESEATALGFSLQLSGTGCGYSSFVWSDPSANTKGRPNNNQVICSQITSPVTAAPNQPSGTAPTAQPVSSGSLRISTIQGSGLTSPYVGQTVSGVQGIVTAKASNLFYMQEATGDGDPNTSDAIIVFTSTAPTVQVGDLVSVTGTVTEFTPGGASTRNLATTEIIGPVVQVLSSGNPLPAPVVIGPGGRILPTESMVAGIQFFESLEAMLVTATSLQVVEATNGFGEIFTILGQDMNFATSNTGRSIRGTINIGPNDFNPEKVQIDPSPASGAGFVLPNVNVGSILGSLTGVVDFNFGNYEIIPVQPLQVIQAVTPPKTIILPVIDPLIISIGTFNVLNLDPNDADGDTDIADGRFASIAAIIANNMDGPDVVGLQEVQDNSGSINDGTISASATLQRLVDAITTVRPTLQYAFIDNPFIGSETNGGQPGGNIRTAYLYNPSRVQFTGTLSSVVNAADQKVNPNNPFYGSRLPLAATFTFLQNGKIFEVVNNHFSSKGGSAPIMGTAQPFETRQEDPTVNGGVDNRRQQSQAIQSYVTGKADTIVLGDLNEFEFVSPVSELGNIMALLTNTIPPNERYSYIFQGNSQAIDHILVSSNLQAGAIAEYIHVNCEYTETDKSRASDHDPMVARIDGRLLQGPVIPNPTSQIPTSSPVSPPVNTPIAAPVNVGPVTFADVWINEFHYDNTGTDADEFIEVAYKTSVDITGYKIVLYNGATSTAAITYSTLSLDSFTKTVTGSIGFAVNPTSVSNLIQNGPSDGMALVDATDRVIQFLSYEGVVTASNGPAIGLKSTDIGKTESEATALGFSLQLTGTGCGYSSFTWMDARASTKGLLNFGQTINC